MLSGSEALQKYTAPSMSSLANSTFTRADCLTPTICLVAYSGFGDPIGRGGGVSEAALAAFDVGALDTGITGIVFDPQEFQPVRLLNGGGGGAVPEPMTWVSLLLGFGLMRAALRRRREMVLSRR